MRKTTANPDRLVHRAQRYVTRLENELTILSGILKTLAAAIKQGDVTDPNDITERLRWVEHQEAQLAASLDTVTAQTSELMRQLDAALTPEDFTPAQNPLNIAISPFPESFQGDMDKSFQQIVSSKNEPPI